VTGANIHLSLVSRAEFKNGKIFSSTSLQVFMALRLLFLRKVRLFWHIAGKEKYEASKNLLAEIKKIYFFSDVFITLFGFINNISGLH